MNLKDFGKYLAPSPLIFNIVLCLVGLQVGIHVFMQIRHYVKLPIQQDVINMRLDSISAINYRLNNEIIKSNQKNEANAKQIDSLEKVKQKIKIIYLEKSKEIDNASVGVIVNEFENVFSTNDIK